MRAVRIERFGGPEVLQLVEIAQREPGRGEARVAHRAIGLNFVDTYYRTGLYPLDLPSGLGSEASGIVLSTGPDVEHVKPGDRVAYAAPPPLGSYADERVLDARWLVRLPAAIGDETAAAMMLKGLTSWFLLNRSYRVQPGDWLLLYAAAGGVGLIAAQWARALGARVIGVVGTLDKRALALAHGCEHVLLADDDVVSAVRKLTGGSGVPVVYDSVGRATFFQSLDCLRPHGVMVSFGNSSGPVAPFSLLELTRRGSLYVTRPTLFDFVRERHDLEAASRSLLDAVHGGAVRIEVRQHFALSDVAAAHCALEQRRTTGSSVLLP